MCITDTVHTQGSIVTLPIVWDLYVQQLNFSSSLLYLMHAKHFEDIVCYCICTGWAWEQCWLKVIQWSCVYSTVFTCMFHYQSCTDSLHCLRIHWVTSCSVGWFVSLAWVNSSAWRIKSHSRDFTKAKCVLLIHREIKHIWLRIKTFGWFFLDVES